MDWARLNRPLLLQHKLYATGTTGTLLEQDLTVRVHKLQSGPLGGDQQVGARITEGEIDLLIFFWDPLQAHPHDPDVRALLRVAVLWNIPVACNRASADYMISSPLLSGAYQRRRPHTRRTENDPSQGPRWRSPAGRRAGRRRQRARRQPRKGAVMQARWPRDASCAVAP